MPDDAATFTYDELAARLGVSRAAARILAQRKVKAGAWSRITGNDGRARVRVPLADLEGHRQAHEAAQEAAQSDPVQAARPGTVQEAQAALVVELRGRLEDRAAELARVLADLERARTDLAAEREHGRALALRLADLAAREQPPHADNISVRPWWRRFLRR